MAADVNGLLSSYGLTGGVPISIDVVIDLLDSTELPFQRGFMLGGKPALAGMTVTNKKMEWQDDTLLEALSTINEGGQYSNSDVTLTATDGTRFKEGDVIRIDAEHLYVSSVSTNDLTVIRAYAGTSATTHEDGARILGVGQALPEGNDAILASHVDRDRRHNFTQIFGPRKVQATGTEQNMPKYGLVQGGEMLYQIDKEMIELSQVVERAIVYGQRYDDGADQRTMGGIEYYITTNEDSTSTALTEAAIGDQMEKMYNAGARPGQGFMLAMNLANKRVVNAIGTVELMRADNGRGTLVDHFDLDTGRVQCVISPYIENGDAFLLTPDQVKFGDFRPWQLEPLAKTGDADIMQLVSEKTLELKRQRHAAKFSALTTTSA